MPYLFIDDLILAVKSREGRKGSFETVLSVEGKIVLVKYY